MPHVPQNFSVTATIFLHSVQSYLNCLPQSVQNLFSKPSVPHEHRTIAYNPIVSICSTFLSDSAVVTRVRLLPMLASQSSCSITFWASFSGNPFTYRACTVACRTGDHPIFCTFIVFSGHEIHPSMIPSCVVSIGFLSSLLFLSPSGSSSLMTFPLVAPGTFDLLSTWILFITHVRLHTLQLSIVSLTK